MPYQFALEDRDYSDYASGRVIYNLPGLPAFPVRLASEIFLRALHRLGGGNRLTLYDPTCGGAYHLTALGFLHGESIGKILASDVDERALVLARRNLGLLTPQGLDQREQEIAGMLATYQKESHAQALHSVSVLRLRLERFPPIQTRVFPANVLVPAALGSGLAGESVDLVFSDIPYGQLTGWQPADNGQPVSERSPVWHMLDTLLVFLPPTALVAIAADKHQKIGHERYRRIEHFQIGKRQVSFLQPETGPG